MKDLGIVILKLLSCHEYFYFSNDMVASFLLIYLVTSSKYCFGVRQRCLYWLYLYVTKV